MGVGGAWHAAMLRSRAMTATDPAAKTARRVPRLIGMVHVGALPGTPKSRAGVTELAEAAAAEAGTLVEAGFDAVMLENMHDVPYLRRDVGPEIVAAMTAVTATVRRAVDVPLGVQILAGANRAAMAVAHATGAEFIRAEGFAYAAVADEGLLDEADAGPLLRERRRLDASVAVWADVRKKHSAHAITDDLDLAEHVRGAIFCGADAVIVTGTSTGASTDPADIIEAVDAAGDVPIVVGSGVTADTVRDVFARGAAGAIVGTAIKAGGDWRRPVDADRARALVAAAG